MLRAAVQSCILAMCIIVSVLCWKETGTLAMSLNQVVCRPEFELEQVWLSLGAM